MWGGSDARTLAVQTLWMIQNRNDLRLKWLETTQHLCVCVGGGVLKGTNPANMARAQVQWLNWLNSLWNGISKTTFHLLDGAESLNWVALPFHILLPLSSASCSRLPEGFWWLMIPSCTYDPVQSSCYSTQVSEIFFSLSSSCCSPMHVFLFFFNATMYMLGSN